MDSAVTVFGLAMKRFDEDRLDEARDICRRIITCDPNHVGALHMLAILARKRGQNAEALELMEQALKIAPDRAVLWFDRGTALFETDRLELAVDAYRHAWQIDPRLQEAALNLGALLEKMERYDEAQPFALRAIELKPTCHKAHYNLGNIYRATGRLAEAANAYREAVRLEPQYAQAHWNLSHCYLLLGDFARGWPAYEWREKASEVFLDRQEGLRWDGSSLAGKTLLVHAEQGIGDEVMFASCYQEVVAQAKHCIFVSEPRLAQLIRRSYPRATVYAHIRRNDWAPAPVEEAYDLQIAAGSLPLYLRRSAADFPARRRYLTPDPAAVDNWKARLAELGAGLKIGISWRAGGRPSERRRRSTTLADWRELLTLRGTHWINLQYGETGEEIQAARDELGVEIHDFAEGDPLVDMDQFAAKLGALDLVLSVGNATVHLAGALGVNTWAMLPPVPGWRWQIEGTTTPWYPSVRLYRQSASADAAATLQQIRTDLAAALRTGNLELPLEGSGRPPALPARPPIRSSANAAGESVDALLPLSHDSLEFTSRALPAAMLKAVEHHRAGEFVQAEQIYREVLYHLPRNTEAQRLLGTLARQTGRPQLAVNSFRRALAAGDQTLETRIQLAASLRDADHLDESLTAYEEILRLAPDSLESMLGIAKTLVRLCRPDEAQAYLETALNLSPEFPEAHFALAGILADDGQDAAAMAACDRSIAGSPNYALAHARRAELLDRMGKTQAAIAAIDTALAIQPDQIDWLRFLGELLRKEGRSIEAEQAYQQALKLDPNSALLLNDLGLALADQGCFEEAQRAYASAIDRDAQFAPAHLNRAVLRLQQGHWAEGWREYRWRWKCPEFPPRGFFRQPAWDGSPLSDRTILVHCEQGIGDEIMFAGCLPEVVEQAQHMVLVCEPRLAPLFARSFPQAIVHGVGRGREHLWTVPAVPTIDVQVPLGDLPGFLRPSAASFPRRPSYLKANPARVEFWRARLAQLGAGLKIGISWRAGARPHDRRLRSAPLTSWKSLLSHSGAQFIALEEPDCRADVEACRQSGGRLHMLPGISPRDNVDELAAAIGALDLVVSVGNTNIHLAGALGVRAWALVPRYQGWCWPLEGEEMFWYSSVRVLRQATEGDWSGLLGRVEGDFLNWLRANTDNQSIGA